MIELEIDGQKLTVAPGTTIIEAADSVGIYIPRYCYHKKLSVAANCRMCLIEVEKVKKPLPACATPVTQDMKVWTRSPMTVQAQRDVLEFLLINHPLDCPICDQGGVCELQDYAMAYGKGRSHFDENKIACASEDVGPLIETWMTRCIKCTRCVRFGEEIAGMRELGVVNRGQYSEISTYVSTFINSPVSANITDICPVGALTPKPTRYQVRDWELQESDGVAPHDCVGSNLYFHTGGHSNRPQRRIVSIVPRENEVVNETWLSDRARFGFLGLDHAERCTHPMRKEQSKWRQSSWQRVLAEIVDKLTAIIQHQGADQVAFLASPNATTEELYLMQKLARALGCHNIDHRLRQQDLSPLESMPLSCLGMSLEQLQECDHIAIVGSDVCFEQPLLAHRIRQATLDQAAVSVINPVDFNFNFDVKDQDIVKDIHYSFAALAKALGVKDEALAHVTPQAFHKDLAQQLLAAEQPVIMLGLYAMQIESALNIKALAQRIQATTKVNIAWVTEGANTAGAWRAGMVPHRDATGAVVATPGKSAIQVLGKEPVRAYVLLQFEATKDVAAPALALKALDDAALVVCLSAFMTEAMHSYADFVLPIAPFMENKGSFINVAGLDQNFEPASVPHYEAKPAWKILRAIGSYFELDDFSFQHWRELRDELNNLPYQFEENTLPLLSPSAMPELQRYAYVPMYDSDPMVRRSKPLAETNLKCKPFIGLNPHTAQRLGFSDGVMVTASQGDFDSVTLPLVIDAGIAEEIVVLPSATDATAGFGLGHGAIELKEASC